MQGKKLEGEELRQRGEEMMGAPIIVCQALAISVLDLDGEGTLGLVLSMEPAGSDIQFHFAHNPEGISELIRGLQGAKEAYEQLKAGKLN